MRYRKLTSTGDYSFGGSEKDFWKDVPNAVGQAVQTRLELWLGEWYQNLEEGTPFLQGILGKYNKETADTVIQDRISKTQGFVSFQEYVSDVDAGTRIMSLSATINTIYGVVEVVTAVNFVTPDYLLTESGDVLTTQTGSGLVLG